MELVFATHNPNKLVEVKKLIKHFKLLDLNAIHCLEDIPETQSTIKGNAIQKANYVYANYKYNCFADDTGLEVLSLNGEPGVYSARYAGLQRNANDNINLLLKNLENKHDRTAQFKTVIALNINGQVYTFTGICKGEVTKEKKGTNGFGYDPIFKPNGYTKTFAELDLKTKNNIGHRGKAIQQLIVFLKRFRYYSH